MTIIAISLIAIIVLANIQYTQAITDFSKDNVLKYLENSIAKGTFKESCNNNETRTEFYENQCKQMKEIINNTSDIK